MCGVVFWPQEALRPYKQHYSHPADWFPCLVERMEVMISVDRYGEFLLQRSPLGCNASGETVYDLAILALLLPTA
jgi:hypothetical protein